MKTTFICVLLLIALPAISQNKEGIQDSTYNFRYSEGSVYWQRVFETKLSFDQLMGKIKDSDLLNNIDIRENKIRGNLNHIVMDYKGAGYTLMTMPIYLRSSEPNCFISIDFKDGAYRVTATNIVMIWKETDPLFKKDKRINIEDFAIKTNKTKFKETFKQKGGDIFDYTFDKLFRFKDQPNEKKW